MNKVEVRQVVNTVFKSCSYVVVHDGNSWLVDCGDVDRILPLIDGQLKGVLLTHGHFDHLYGLNMLIALFPKVPVYTSPEGQEELLSDKLNFSKYYGEPFVLDAPDNVNLIGDGECVPLFDGIEAKAFYTPGHSPSCVTWQIGDSLFTGDSFIPGVKTVTNLPHADKIQAAKSEMLIRDLASDRVVYAGHAPEL